MTANVTIARDGEVAVLTINNPPVNACSLEVRRALQAAIEAADREREVAAIVIIGGGATFVAGSDLREFGAPLEDPQLPAVIDAIEACGKPVVAALHGAALGGGFELALGCDARIASAGTVIGLPEVTLGIIPGAGGTQRLPRVVGMERAIGMICSGERVTAEAAFKLGVVDEVVDGDLRDAAVRFATSLDGKKSPLRSRNVTVADEAAVAAACAQALRTGKNRPPVRAAIEAVSNASRLPMDEALRLERAAFQELRTGRDARALRHLFFAERAAAKQVAPEGTEVRVTKRVAVIGSGTMGSGIAIAALDGGFEVVLLDIDADALERGAARIREHYTSRADAGKISSEVATERLSCLAASTDWAALADADLIIEAVFEDIEVKREVFRQLDRVARPGAILASNTSYLDLNAIAGATLRPHDVVGLHFFSPANVMRLVEVVRGADTAPGTLLAAVSFARKLQKLPVVTGNAFGFIGNRIYAASRRQCEFLLEEGAYPEQVDAALEKFGFAMGPFAVADMSGLDIAWRMRKSQAAQRVSSVRTVHIPDRLCEAGRLGRKTGAGYYRYEAGSRKGAPDDAVRQLIEAASREKGIVRRPIADEEIQRRVLLTMVNEAALLYGEGVASRAGDIDVVMVNGYGFPRWEGGPVFWAHERGRPALKEDMRWLAEVSGAGFRLGNVDCLWESEDRHERA